MEVGITRPRSLMVFGHWPQYIMVVGEVVAALPNVFGPAAPRCQALRTARQVQSERSRSIGTGVRHGVIVCLRPLLFFC